MSCALTQGYTVPCRFSKGGIKTVYIVELANVTAVTAASGIITAITTSVNFHTYQQRPEVSSFTEGIQVSDTNGTVYYEQDLILRLEQLQASLRNELKLIAQNYICAIVLDRNGNYWLLGQNNGLWLQPSKAETGKGMGDFNGYELTFKGKEEQPAQQISATIISGIIQ